jgi:flagellar export protein FliJ
MAFRLARVLRLRTLLRRRTQDEVAQLAAALGAVRREIAELGRQQRAVRAEEEAALRRGLAAADLDARRRYEAELLARAAACAADEARLVAALVEERTRLVERRREERQLERLAEQAAARTAEAMARADAVALDDLARRRR